MKVANDLGLFDLGRSGIQEPGLGVMGIADLEHRRILQGIDFQAVGIPGREGVAHDLIVQRRRRAGNGIVTCYARFQVGSA